MPLLANQRHEMFAQEVASGKGGSEAYLASGFKSTNKKGISVNACRLNARPAIRARINEILASREKAATSAARKATDALGIDKQYIMRGLMEDRELARKLKQTASAIRALELLGKELGMFIDRKSVDIKRSIRELSEDEILALLAVESADGATATQAGTEGSDRLH